MCRYLSYVYLISYRMQWVECFYLHSIYWRWVLILNLVRNETGIYVREGERQHKTIAIHIWRVFWRKEIAWGYWTLSSIKLCDFFCCKNIGHNLSVLEKRKLCEKVRKLLKRNVAEISFGCRSMCASMCTRNMETGPTLFHM